MFESLLDAYPKELLVAFGLGEGSFRPRHLPVGLRVQLPVAARLGDRGDRTWDPRCVRREPRLPRRRAVDAPAAVDHLFGSIATQIVGIAIVAAAMVIGVFVGDLLIAPNFPEDRVALSTLHSFAFGAAIAGPATLLAVVLLDRGRAAGIVAGVLVVMYLFNVVAALAPDVDWLASLSAFHYFNLQGLIGTGDYPFADSLLLGAIAVSGWTLALIAFRRRDLAA